MSTMAHADDTLRGPISQRAADWLVKNRAGTTPAERAEFFAWLKSSRVHVEEYLVLASISRDLSLMQSDPRFDLEQLIEQARTVGLEPAPGRARRVLGMPPRLLRDLGFRSCAVCAGERWVHVYRLGWHESAYANTRVRNPDVVVTLKSTGCERGMIMRELRLILGATLTLVASALVAASPAVAVRPLTQINLRDYSDLYAWIVEYRRLGSPYDLALMRNIQTHSTVEHFRDNSPEHIAVVKVELLNDDGTSKARSEYGNYPFYVIRETPKGLVLMGEMYGRTYRSTVIGGNREFFVELHRSVTKVVQMHFRVVDSKLVNLSTPAEQGDDFIAVAAR